MDNVRRIGNGSIEPSPSGESAEDRLVQRMSVEEHVERLRKRVFPLARLVHELTQALDAPALFDYGVERGFRYQKPQLVHFCLLRGVRIVSALNASIELARCGFPQEIGVLLRTMAEYTTQIDFMLASRDENGTLSSDAALFINGYFEDAHRPERTDGKKAKLPQGEVHKLIGAQLDEVSASSNGRKPAAHLLWNVYRIFSNYVHGRYPESMDLYGGNPGRFHLNGMRGTPKDAENIAMLDAMITSASNCLKGLVQGLHLYSIVDSDPMLRTWFREE